MSKRLIAVAAGLMVAGSVNAAEDLEIPPVLEDLNLPDVEVEKRFETEIPGIVGWAVNANGEKNLLYTTEDGRHAILGMMLGEGGKNLTEQHAMEHLGKKPGNLPGSGKSQDDSIDAEQAMEAMKEAPFHVEEGSGDTVLYASFDPECPHCARYYQNTRELLDEFTIRWVPVAQMAPSSLDQAAALVEADNPAEALARLEAGDLSTGEVSDEAKRTIRENTSMLQGAGLRATPITVFEDADGEPRVMRGAADAQRLHSAQ